MKSIQTSYANTTAGLYHVLIRSFADHGCQSGCLDSNEAVYVLVAIPTFIRN